MTTTTSSETQGEQPNGQPECRYGDCTAVAGETILFEPVDIEKPYCSMHAEVARRYWHQEHDDNDPESPRFKSLEEIEDTTELVVCDCGCESFFAMQIGNTIELRCEDCATLHRPTVPEEGR